MLWGKDEIAALSQRYGVRPGIRLHAAAEDYHFPDKTFLRDGYAPPGGYVKDFGIILADGRLHLFHIDGRPGEVCWVTGNEISFGHASTADGCRWLRHRMPLAVGDRPWESEHVWAPFVYRRADLYYMFYMGSGGGETFISYATSSDLDHWTRWPQGPIRCAVGRDPFVCDQGDRTLLLYTGHGGARVAACASRDMIDWEALPDVLVIPKDNNSGAAESCSLHPLGEQYVLWFNDYGVVSVPTGKGYRLTGFRAAYALSDDPLHFDPQTIREFRFVTDAPGVVPSLELPVDKPTPLSIELVARGERLWLVAYFRWQTDRNRLFFGTLDWSSTPATITEIGSEAQLRQVLHEVGMQGVGESSVTGSDGGYLHHQCGYTATITRETLT